MSDLRYPVGKFDWAPPSSEEQSEKDRVVYIDPNSEPPQVLTNTCASRIFLSRLIFDLGTLNAAIIVIDKYYSNGSCTEADANNTFLNAMDQQDRISFPWNPAGLDTIALSPLAK